MELSPSQKTSIRYQFEVYCKKVIRGERCDYLRQVIRREEREVCFSGLSINTLLQMGTLDDYPSDSLMYLKHRVTGFPLRMNALARRFHRLSPQVGIFFCWPISWI